MGRNLTYKNRIFQGSTARQARSVPKYINPANFLDRNYPKEKTNPTTPVKKEHLTPRQEMMRRSAVINASTRAFKVYTDENDNDPVIGLAAYFETDAYAENVESSGLSLEDFTKAVVARYELLKEIDAGRREGDTDIAKPQVD